MHRHRHLFTGTAVRSPLEVIAKWGTTPNHAKASSMSGSSRFVSAGLRSDKLKLVLSATPSGLSVTSIKGAGAACRSRWPLLSGSPVHSHHHTSYNSSSTLHLTSPRRLFNTMAGYSTTVSKPTLGAAPEGATDHHVRNHKGGTIGYKNANPSAGGVHNTLQMVGKMFM